MDKKNSLITSPKKTKVCCFRPKIKTTKPTVSLNLGKQRMNLVSMVKSLAILFTEQLFWDYRINHIHST